MQQVYALIMYLKNLPGIFTIKVGCSRVDSERANKVMPQIYKFWVAVWEYLRLDGDVDNFIVIESVSVTYDEEVHIEEKERSIRSLHLGSNAKPCLKDVLHHLNTPFDYKFAELFPEGVDFDIDLPRRIKMAAEAALISGYSEVYLIDEQTLNGFKRKFMSRMKKENVELHDIVGDKFTSFDSNKYTYAEYFESVPKFTSKPKAHMHVSRSGRTCKQPKRSNDVLYYDDSSDGDGDSSSDDSFE